MKNLIKIMYKANDDTKIIMQDGEKYRLEMYDQYIKKGETKTSAQNKSWNDLFRKQLHDGYIATEFYNQILKASKGRFG